MTAVTSRTAATVLRPLLRRTGLTRPNCRHASPPAKAKSYSSLMLSTMRTAAVRTASAVTQRGATSSPILRRSAVNITSGTMENGKRKTQHHLAQDQELCRSRLAIPDGHDGGRHDGDRARRQTPRPGRQADVDKALHHDLTRQRRRHRRVQPAAQQRDRRTASAPCRSRAAARATCGLRRVRQRRSVPVLLKVAAARIRIEALISSANISAMVESMVASLIASRFSANAVAEAARLHHAGMQVEIVRHHGRADDADCEIEHIGIGDDLGGRRKAADHRAPFADRPARSGWRSRPR